MGILALVTLLLTPVIVPKADATCHASPAHLGTDNIPMSADDRATSIVNIWYVARSPSEPAEFWIYETFDGRRFVQAKGFQTPTVPFDLRAQRYVSLTRFRVYPCFSRPFPTDQLTDR